MIFLTGFPFDLVERKYKQIPATYSEPCEISKMELFAKLINFYCKKLHLRFLTGFSLWVYNKVTFSFFRQYSKLSVALGSLIYTFVYLHIVEMGQCRLIIFFPPLHLKNTEKKQN